jgi:Domain of unknown function (DUF6759)
MLLGLASIILLTAAVPLPGRGVSFATTEPVDLVRLTVENRTTGYMYMWLKGPQFYYFVIKPESTAYFTIEPGSYYQTVRACGDTASKSINITTHTRQIMPMCGANAKNATSGGGAVYDLSKLIKIVRVTVVNESDTNLVTILTGPATYVFTVYEGDENVYTIAKGKYHVQYWACGKYATRTWNAYSDAKLKLDCPD